MRTILFISLALIVALCCGCGGGTRGTGVGTQSDSSVPAREDVGLTGFFIGTETFQQEPVTVTVQETGEVAAVDESGTFILALTERLGMEATLVITVEEKRFSVTLAEFQPESEVIIDLARRTATYSVNGEVTSVIIPIREL